MSDDYHGILDDLQMSTYNPAASESKLFHEFSAKDPAEFEKYYLRKLAENQAKQAEIEDEKLQESVILKNMKEDNSDDELPHTTKTTSSAMPDVSMSFVDVMQDSHYTVLTGQKAHRFKNLHSESKPVSAQSLPIQHNYF